MDVYITYPSQTAKALESLSIPMGQRRLAVPGRQPDRAALDELRPVSAHRRFNASSTKEAELGGGWPFAALAHDRSSLCCGRRKKHEKSQINGS